MIAEGLASRGQIEYSTDDVLFDGEFSLQATVEVLPESAETVELVSDESLRAAITTPSKQTPRQTARRPPDSTGITCSGRMMTDSTFRIAKSLATS